MGMGRRRCEAHPQPPSPTHLFGRGIAGAARPACAAIAIHIFSGSAGQAGAERLKNMASPILLEDAQDQMRLLRKIIRLSWAEQCGGATGVIEQPALHAADMQACEESIGHGCLQQIRSQRERVEHCRARAGSLRLSQQIIPIERGTMAPQQFSNIAHKAQP